MSRNANRFSFENDGAVIVDNLYPRRYVSVEVVNEKLAECGREIRNFATTPEQADLMTKLVLGFRETEK